MGNPIDLEIMTVTSYYGYRNWGGRRHFHRGVDLRCVNDNYVNKPVLAIEDMEIISVGTGRIGEGYIIAIGLDSGVKFKYIHVQWYKNIYKGEIFLNGDVIGVCNYSGTESLHLHLETWMRGVIRWKHYNPLDYFAGNNIKWIKSRYLK